MRTAVHWQECLHEHSFHEANSVAFQLKEFAKNSGYDPHGIKVLSKNKIIDRGFGRASSAIVWKEGPADWAYNMVLPAEQCYAYDGKTIIFY